METFHLFIEKYNANIDFIKLENGVIYVRVQDLDKLFKPSVKEWFALPERGKLLTWFVAESYYADYNCFKNGKEYELEFYKTIDNKEFVAFDLVCRYINNRDEELLMIINSYFGLPTTSSPNNILK